MENAAIRPKVLIIDDEQNWAKSTAQWLMKTFSELDVIVANSGQDGMSKAEALQPDVFIVDVLLPDMNGMQITRMLRNIPAFVNTPIILMTILQSDQRLLHEALEAGADLYLQKPFEASELKEIISRCMEISDVQKVLKSKQEEVNAMRWSLQQLSRNNVFSSGRTHYFSQRASRLVQLFESAPDAIAVTLPDGTLLEVNNMLCSYTGYSKHELVGNLFSMLFSGEHLERNPFKKAKVLSGEVVENERIIVQKSGCELPVWMKSMLLPDGTVISFMRDVSLLRQTEQELRQQKAFSQKITDKIPNIVYIHDLKQGRNTYTNRSVAASLGYPPEVLTDDAEGFFALVVHPEDYGMFEHFYSRADLNDPELIFHFEYRMKAFSGQWRWFKGYERVWDHENGEITKLIGTVLDVTSEKEKEEALMHSERKYRELMELFRKLSDNMPDMLWAKDVQKRFIFVNKSICQNLLLAADTEEPIGKTDLYFADRIRQERPEDNEFYTFGEICQDSDDVIFETKMPGQFEEFGNVKGKFLSLDVIKAPIFDEHGELVALVGAGRDVTERKRQQQYLSLQHAVAESVATSDSLSALIMKIEQELSALIDTSNFYVALVSETKGKIYTPFLKDEKDDIMERDFEGSATGLVIKSGKVQHFKRDEIDQFISTGILKAIGTIPESWLGVPIYSNELVIGAIVLQSYQTFDAFGNHEIELLEFLANHLGIYIDRMKAQDQNRMLGMAVDQSPAGVMITNATGLLLYTNERFFEISGYGKNEIPAITREILMQMFDDELIVAKIHGCMKERKNWSGQLQLKRPDASKVWISLSLSALFSNSGKITNWLVIIEDHTEKRRILDDLIEARDKAEESDKLKSAFLMNISHEIRTPLNSILGFADLIAGNSANSQEVRSQTALIYRNGQRLLNLINNILKISKIDAGAEIINPVVFSPAQLLDEVTVSFHPQADRQSLKILTSTLEGERSRWVEADLMKIRQVLDNLIGNALKFTDFGEIVVGYRFDGQLIRFFVSDTGRGIPAHEIEKVFERFYQVDNSLNRGHEGAGLGLALCRSMVTLMGGRIWADSEEGNGSVFTFEVPVLMAQEINSPKTEDKERVNVNLSGSGRYKVMVVDDDQSSQIMMKAVLSGAGCETIFASNGQEALEFLDQNKDVGLILLDIKMPVLDGLQTVQLIRQTGNRTSVIATTAYALPGDEFRIRQAGFDGYIAKPFTKSQIINLIDKYRQ